MTIWLLPLIVIGGLFYPILGYLVVAMMAFFLTLSFFKGRYWCWHLCPRGAFLDIVMSKLSRNRRVPGIFTKQAFRWAIVALLMGFLVFRITQTGGNFPAIGAVFAGMCLLTTVISIVLAILTRHRGWCAICPMGTIQGKIGSLGNKAAGGKKTMKGHDSMKPLIAFALIYGLLTAWWSITGIRLYSGDWLFRNPAACAVSWVLLLLSVLFLAGWAASLRFREWGRRLIIATFSLICAAYILLFIFKGIDLSLFTALYPSTPLAFIFFFTRPHIAEHFNK